MFSKKKWNVEEDQGTEAFRNWSIGAMLFTKRLRSWYAYRNLVRCTQI